MTLLYPPFQVSSADKVTNQIEPIKFIQGETLSWKRSFVDYLASAGWTMRYVGVDTGGKITINSTTPDGDNFVMNVASSVTTGYTPGFYEWQSFVISADGTERHKVLEGVWTIEQSFDALTGTYDARTHARKVLDAIEAVIEGRATKDQYEYQIAGRMLRLTPLPDLMKFRQVYRQEVQREDNAAAIKAGLGSKNKISARFNR